MHFNHVRNSMNKYNKRRVKWDRDECFSGEVALQPVFSCLHKWRDNSKIFIPLRLKCLQEIVVINQWKTWERRFENSKQEILSPRKNSSFRCVLFCSKWKSFPLSLERMKVKIGGKFIPVTSKRLHSISCHFSKICFRARRFLCCGFWSDFLENLLEKIWEL